MVTAVVALLLLGAQAGPVQAAKGARLAAPWGDLFGAGPPKLRGSVRRAAVPLPRPRPADAPAAEASPPVAGQPPAASETGKPTEQAAPVAKAGTPALRLPAGVDGGDRDCPQHSRYSWRRRLRR